MIIHVKVYPHSGRVEIVKITEDSFKVYLKKPAEDNKANIELVKLVSKYFKTQVKIVRGLKGREKIVEVLI